MPCSPAVIFFHLRFFSMKPFLFSTLPRIFILPSFFFFEIPNCIYSMVYLRIDFLILDRFSLEQYPRIFFFGSTEILSVSV